MILSNDYVWLISRYYLVLKLEPMIPIFLPFFFLKLVSNLCSFAFHYRTSILVLVLLIFINKKLTAYFTTCENPVNETGSPVDPIAGG